jgi:hypothetical protein
MKDLRVVGPGLFKEGPRKTEGDLKTALGSENELLKELIGREIALLSYPVKDIPV